MRATYDVNAIAYDSTGTMARLFITHPVLTLKECDRQIECWKDAYGYKLIVSWVKVQYEGGSTKIVHFKEYDWSTYKRGR